VSKSRQGRRAVLPVRNTGPLVPDSAIERLFEPFRRLDPRRTSYKDGLGLSIVRAIVTAHGATITAEPFLDGGVAIEVTFPPSTRPRSVWTKQQGSSQRPPRSPGLPDR
jgi:signal transduction histidine kinase